ncbi:MAG: ribose 5-phosphate isomerase B [Ignavibacteria bacterium]|nr:ribose 5-phosphate isomerase B [Ignavibacteria bacterium]
MKKLITEQDILNLLKSGSTIFVKEKDMVLTPLALDRIKIAGIMISDGTTQTTRPVSSVNDYQFKSIVVGSDHTGFSVKKEIIGYLQKEGFIVTDIGCYSEESCDYPDFAIAAAQKVQKKEIELALLFDATGIPSAITANKLKGIRAVTLYNEFSAKSARSHNNANVAVLGAKTLGIETIKSILHTFLTTAFEGGRHQKRLDKIHLLEK